MKRIAMVAVLVGTIGLGACTDAQKDDGWLIACASVAPADLLFNTYAAGGRVPQNVIDKERQAVAGAQALCAGPRPTNVATSLRALTAFLTAIASETARARTAAAVRS